MDDPPNRTGVADMNKKVLIVADHRGLRRGLARILMARGYTTAEAEDASSAITVARSALPDVVLLDLELPKDGGISVLARREQLPELSSVPVVVLTGLEPESSELSLERFAIAEILTKPVDHNVLVRAIKHALVRPRPADGTPLGS